MADEKAPIIIKRINKGHAGAHGGAWKVAFADFMTAMMAFFLVMWLMGSDDETKQAVAKYFTSSTFKGGSDSLGKNGISANTSASILNGEEGRFEEKDVTAPGKPKPVYLEEHKVLNNLVEEIFDGNAFSEDINSEYLKFAISGNIFFLLGSTDISYEGKKYLEKLAEVFKNYEGSVSIIGHTEKGEGDSDQANWELAFKRAMSIRSSLIKDFKVRPDQLTPSAQSYTTSSPVLDAKGDNTNRRVEFILHHKNN